MPEDRCYELDRLLETMDDMDKKFLLWQLIKEYRDQLEDELFDHKKTSKTKERYMEMRIKERHYSTAIEMSEMLGYDLF